MDELAALWASIRRRDVFPVSVPGLARGLLGRRNFLFASLGLRNVIMGPSWATHGSKMHRFPATW
jgi:NTE family protein